MKMETGAGLIVICGILVNIAACWRTDVYVVLPDSGAATGAANTGTDGAASGGPGAVPS